MEKPPKKLLDQVRELIRRKHYSIRTEQAYVLWIKRYILFHNKRHPRDIRKHEIEVFLTHLAVDLKVASSTQNQALSAIFFFYRDVLKKELGWLDDVERAKRPARLPVVLIKQEVDETLLHLEGTPWLMTSLLYGVESQIK